MKQLVIFRFIIAIALAIILLSVLEVFHPLETIDKSGKSKNHHKNISGDQSTPSVFLPPETNDKSGESKNHHKNITGDQSTPLAFLPLETNDKSGESNNLLWNITRDRSTHLVNEDSNQLNSAVNSGDFHFKKYISKNSSPSDQVYWSSERENAQQSMCRWSAFFVFGEAISAISKQLVPPKERLPIKIMNPIFYTISKIENNTAKDPILITKLFVDRIKLAQHDLREDHNHSIRFKNELLHIRQFVEESYLSWRSYFEPRQTVKDVENQNLLLQGVLFRMAMSVFNISIHAVFWGILLTAYVAVFIGFGSIVIWLLWGIFSYGGIFLPYIFKAFDKIFRAIVSAALEQILQLISRLVGIYRDSTSTAYNLISIDFNYCREMAQRSRTDWWITEQLAGPRDTSLNYSNFKKKEDAIKNRDDFFSISHCLMLGFYRSTAISTDSSRFFSGKHKNLPNVRRFLSIWGTETVMIEVILYPENSELCIFNSDGEEQRAKEVLRNNSVFFQEQKSQETVTKVFILSPEMISSPTPIGGNSYKQKIEVQVFSPLLKRQVCRCLLQRNVYAYADLTLADFLDALQIESNDGLLTRISVFSDKYLLLLDVLRDIFRQLFSIMHKMLELKMIIGHQYELDTDDFVLVWSKIGPFLDHLKDSHAGRNDSNNHDIQQNSGDLFREYKSGVINFQLSSLQLKLAGAAKFVNFDQNSTDVQSRLSSFKRMKKVMDRIRSTIKKLVPYVDTGCKKDILEETVSCSPTMLLERMFRNLFQEESLEWVQLYANDVSLLPPSKKMEFLLAISDVIHSNKLALVQSFRDSFSLYTKSCPKTFNDVHLAESFVKYPKEGNEWIRQDVASVWRTTSKKESLKFEQSMYDGMIAALNNMWQKRTIWAKKHKNYEYNPKHVLDIVRVFRNSNNHWENDIIGKEDLWILVESLFPTFYERIIGKFLNFAAAKYLAQKKLEKLEQQQNLDKRKTLELQNLKKFNGDVKSVLRSHNVYPEQFSTPGNYETYLNYIITHNPKSNVKNGIDGDENQNEQLSR